MRVCPACGTELTRVHGRRAGRLLLWCWKCERHWKAGVDSDSAENRGNDRA